MNHSFNPMYKILFLLMAVCLYALPATAQLNRSKVPAPGPAPAVNLGKAESFTLSNGLRVFVVENHKLPKIAVSLYLDRDPIIEGKSAGYLSAVGELILSGTRSRTKAEIDESADFIGAILYSSSKSLYGECLIKHKETLLELMSDVLLESEFQQVELDRIRKQSLSSLAQSKESPGTLNSRVSNRVNYGTDHPFGEFATEESWNNISLRQCKRYYETFWRPNIGYLAIIGDINTRDARKLVEQYFGSWERGDIPSYRYDLPKGPDARQVALVDRASSVQSNIRITYPLDLKNGDPDEFPAILVNAVLGYGSSSRLFQNLRETHGFTYSAYSYLSRSKWGGSFNALTEVRNSVTDSAITEILREMKRIRDQGVSEKELQVAKNLVMGSFTQGLEDPQTLARYALNIEVLGLPKDYYQNYLKNIDAVSLEQVREAARKYIKPDRANVVVVGKGAELAEGLKFFGDLTYYDPYATPYDPAGQGIRKGLTADMVLQKYMQAIGGADKLSKIDNLSLKYRADLFGRMVTLTEVRKAPNLFKQDLEGDVFTSKLIFDGENAVRKSTTGGVNKLSGSELEAVRYEGLLFPELYYTTMGFQTELSSIVNIGERQAFEMKVTAPDGQVSSHYFDTRSGMKLREVRTVKGPGGSQLSQTLDFEDFKQVEGGLRIPHLIKQKIGNDVLELNLVETTFDQDLKKKDFLVE